MLNEIIEHKRKEVQEMTLLSCSRMKPVLDFAGSLRKKPFIAEVKKASPSLGDINLTVDPVAQAVRYEEYGAGCVSVLTDKKYFKGDIEFLKAVSAEVSIPTLCKDFIVDPIQIDNAYCAGADAILLIAAALSAEELMMLSDHARRLELQVLFEIHEFEEIVLVEPLAPEMVGVNSRNLKTMQIDLDDAAEVLRDLRGDYLKIAESGIENGNHVKKMRKAGADAFLIGSMLMKTPDLKASFAELYEGAGVCL